MATVEISKEQKPEPTKAPVESTPKTITLRISRFNPSENAKNKFEEFKIPVQKWTTVLEAILYVKQNLDHSIAVRYSCRQAS